MGSAYAAHEEHLKGSLELGKLADLVVYRQDPFTVPVDDLTQVKPCATMVNGKMVYWDMD